MYDYSKKLHDAHCNYINVWLEPVSSTWELYGVSVSYFK